MTVLNPPVAVQAATTTNADDIRGALVAAMAGSSALTPRAGIAPGWGAELSVAQSGTPAMNVVVGSGMCLLPAPTAGHGGWWLINDGSLTKTITAAHATLSRTDLIIARVADVTYHTGGDGLADIKVITGTAGGGVPTVPTADGSYIVLARVAVAANATSITNANITLSTSASRPYTAALGARLPVADQTARLALTPFNGMQVLQLDTAQHWDYALGAWLPQPLGRTDDVELASWNTLIHVNNVAINANSSPWGYYHRHQRHMKAISYTVQGDGQALSGNISCSLPASKYPYFGTGANQGGMGDLLGTFSWQMRADNGFAVGVGLGSLLYNPTTTLVDCYKADGTRFSTTMAYLIGIRVNFDYFTA